MLKLSNIRLAEQPDNAGLLAAAARVLGVAECLIKDLAIHRLSVDARRKPDVRFVCTILFGADDEGFLLDKGIPDLSSYALPEKYVFPAVDKAAFTRPPVIVGSGPAGLFAALSLAEAGVKCIVLERGTRIERRVADVARFMGNGIFDAASNVQFGEGGAGTFSDGKLTTGISDARVRFVLESLVRFGAPGDILYLSRPHIGTDRLRGLVTAIRGRLAELGCDLRFGHRLDDICLSGGALQSITVDDGGGIYSIEADTLILAPGNSARDTFEMLFRRGVKIAPKEFSAGVRIEHLQRDIDSSQYGRGVPGAGAPLPAADYKLAVKTGSGRSVYSFCVCPGGQVVAAASEPNGVVTNGMSMYARDGDNCNGALLVNVTPDDFGHGALDGLRFQRRLERDAFECGGGGYFAPAQLVGDFLARRASEGCERVRPTYAPGVRYCNLWDVLPGFICEALASALPEFSKRIAGFAHPDSVLTAVETRSSSPVRIVRENYEAVGVKGIFPCGEGSGYSGGIMSSAVDGIKCAEHVAGATCPAHS